MAQIIYHLLLARGCYEVHRGRMLAEYEYVHDRGGSQRQGPSGAHAPDGREPRRRNDPQATSALQFVLTHHIHCVQVFRDDLPAPEQEGYLGALS